jgi:hypothetical protein
MELTGDLLADWSQRYHSFRLLTEQTAFEDTKKHSRCHQAGVVRDETLADHRQGPEEHNESEPNRRPGALHHHVRRDLSGDVEGKENGETVIVL